MRFSRVGFVFYQWESKVSKAGKMYRSGQILLLNTNCKLPFLKKPEELKQHSKLRKAVQLIKLITIQLLTSGDL